MATLKFIRQLFLLFISLIIYHSVFAQKSSRHFIDSTLLSRDTAFRLTERTMYILNGVPYDNISLDSVLSNLDTKHLLDIVYWNGKKNGGYPFDSDAIIIVFAYPQKAKSKRTALKSAIKLFNASSNPPILVIDSFIIDRTISKDTIKKLKLRDIMYIDTVPEENEYKVRVWTTH